MVSTPAASPASSSTPALAASASPVPEDVTAAMTRTMELIVACSNEGEFGRVAALITDGYWQREIRSPMDVQALAIVISDPPVPVSAEERETLIAIRDPQFLEDGRISAVVVLSNTRDAEPDPDLVIFERVGAVWLVDEVIADYAVVATQAA